MIERPEYFEQILDEVEFNYINPIYVAGFSIYDEDGGCEYMNADDFEFMFDEDIGCGMDINEFLQRNKVRMVVNRDTLWKSILFHRETILASLP